MEEMQQFHAPLKGAFLGLISEGQIIVQIGQIKKNKKLLAIFVPHFRFLKQIFRANVRNI
jgi:hypothetical protein